MKKLLLAAAVLAVGVGGAVAQGDVINQRKDLMKAVGQATAPIGRMMRNEAPFDQAAVTAALNTYIRAAKESPALYPANSATGDTRATPAAFTDKDRFNGLFANFERDATAALAAIRDEATFRAEMPKVLRNCGACHEPFRRPQ